jgi:hypothetical protein
MIKNMKKPVIIYFGLALGAFCFALLISTGAFADPSRYPQSAQHQLPEGVTPDFIKLDDLVDEIIQKQKPLYL